MKTLNKFLWTACLLTTFACSGQQKETLVSEYGSTYHWEGHTIVTDTPERPAGQEHALGLKVPKIEVVRVGSSDLE